LFILDAVIIDNGLGAVHWQLVRLQRVSTLVGAGSNEQPLRCRMLQEYIAPPLPGRSVEEEFLAFGRHLEVLQTCNGERPIRLSNRTIQTASPRRRQRDASICLAQVT